MVQCHVAVFRGQLHSDRARFCVRIGVFGGVGDKLSCQQSERNGPVNGEPHACSTICEGDSARGPAGFSTRGSAFSATFSISAVGMSLKDSLVRLGDRRAELVPPAI
jgi:hypothetical protein